MDLQEIALLQQQFQARLWPKWLESIGIQGLRGWTGQTVTLSFPVVAVVGENGTGKTTLLRAAACAYEANGGGTATFFPSDLFRKTPWDRVENVILSYVVRQGQSTVSFELRKPSERWSYPEERPRRNVFFFDISRILPIDASIGYAKIAKQRVAEVSTEEIQPEYRERLSHTLGRSYTKARFATTQADASKPVGLLTRDGVGEISQFHQGAGEDATLDLFRVLQSIPDTSMLIIDEVEASLHPRAQRRLMRFLLALSRKKRLQILVSTHSPFILEELPPQARILLLPSANGVDVVYGASPEFSLSRLDDSVHSELHVFVEDEAASVLLREILAVERHGQQILPRIQIVPVGAANVVKVLGRLGTESRLPYRSVGVLDGDEPPTQGCTTLPGSAAPERVVFTGLRAKNWPQLPARFGVGAGDLFEYLEQSMLEPDHHRWTALVGDRVLKSRLAVWEILASEWARSCLDPAERRRIVDFIAERLPPAGAQM